ncbi:Hypp4305 [Branchiostoma lanceolatum]|uniref:Hypp4305 protein n=1 Tax=Branchiostoma lanceolatum TaxID=7740 RepID=A0A8K0A7I4_BRALA|nr:Hypp4305 [Branchiostoma lanceolatum]
MLIGRLCFSVVPDCGRYTEALGDFSIRAADYSRRGYSKCSVQIVAPQNKSIELSITRLKGFPVVNITNPLAQCLPKLEVREEGLLGDVRLVYSICNGLEEDSIPLNIRSTQHHVILDFLWDRSADSSFQARYSFQDSTQVEGEKNTFEDNWQSAIFPVCLVGQPRASVCRSAEEGCRPIGRVCVTEAGLIPQTAPR